MSARHAAPLLALAVLAAAAFPVAGQQAPAAQPTAV